ncbi:hypothetical protein [Pantoea rodasii]|nr:hypothetical protein [Pantoea rodasii]
MSEIERRTRSIKQQILQTRVKPAMTVFFTPRKAKIDLNQFIVF